METNDMVKLKKTLSTITKHPAYDIVNDTYYTS